MMGVNHAATGAAAWVAVTSTAIPALGWYPPTAGSCGARRGGLRGCCVAP